MANKYNDRDYLFVTSVLRARQAKMLTGEQMEQMIAAGNFEDAAKILSEAGWPEMSGASCEEIDRILTKRREDIFSDVSGLMGHPEVVDIFRTRYDYHNAKSVIKGEAASVEVDGILSNAGRVSKEEMQKAFLEDNFRFLPDRLGKAMREAKSVLARTENPQLADFELDRAYYEEITKISQGVGNEYLREYVKCLIDGANLRTVVRCARMNKDTEFLKGALMPGGNISEKFILGCAASGEGATGAFVNTIYKDVAPLGAEAMKAGHLTTFELECDNAVNRYIAGAKLKGFGAEAVIGYLAAEENNITAVRMILTGLKTGVSPAKLSERLRESYV